MTYCRRESPTQTTQDAIKQVRSSEIWGGIPNGGMCPTVQAYTGKLINNQRGIEFETQVLPENSGSSPFESRWYLNITPGVLLRTNINGDDMACIPAVVTNLQPVQQC